MQHVCRTARIVTIATAVLLSVVAKRAAADSFVNFESGHVRPLVLSPDGTTLFDEFTAQPKTPPPSSCPAMP